MRLWMMLIVAGLLAACTATAPAETAVSPVSVGEAGNGEATAIAPTTAAPVAVATAAAPTAVVPTAAVTGVMSDLPDLGAAPEITNQVWVNADAPVTLASQRGKVVLVEFWTFG